MEEIQGKDFNLANYEHLFEQFDLATYRVKVGEIDVKLTPTQNQLYKYAEVNF